MPFLYTRAVPAEGTSAGQEEYGEEEVACARARAVIPALHIKIRQVAARLRWAFFFIIHSLSVGLKIPKDGFVSSYDTGPRVILCVRWSLFCFRLAAISSFLLGPGHVAPHRGNDVGGKMLPL